MIQISSGGEKNSVKPAVEVVTSHLASACHWALIMDTERAVYVLRELISVVRELLRESTAHPVN